MTGHTGRPLRLWLIVESGTDVRIVDGLAGFSEVTVMARRIDGGVEISRPPASAAAVTVGPPSVGRFAAEAFSAIRREKARIDFVLVQGYGLAALAANLAMRLTGIPGAMLVCSPVEEYYRCRAAEGSDKPFRRHELLALQAVARLNARLGNGYVVLSQHLADVVRRHGARGPVDVIPVYGVDTRVFHPVDTHPSELRRLRGLPATGQIVFYSSRIAPEKDSATLLEAFRRLRGDGRDVHILHRSGGHRQFMDQARQRGVAPWVIATDAVHPHAELPLDYCASDLCVQASRAEGLGYSVLEALACETPVVATSVGGLKETIIDGDTGWTCPPGDAGAMAAVLAIALDNPEEARRRAQAGRRMVQARYDAEIVFSRLDDLIRGRVDKSSVRFGAVAAGT